MSWARASVGAQLRLAGLLWTAPGLGLSTAGVFWIFSHASGLWLAGWLVLALLIGLGKGRFLRNRPAQRVVNRIRSRGADTALGSWLGRTEAILLPIMMGAGMLLRRSPLPRDVLGAIYLGIGLALLYASLRFWRSAPETAELATS